MRTLIPVITNITQSLFSRFKDDQTCDRADKQNTNDNRVIEVAVNGTLISYAVWVIAGGIFFNKPVFSSNNILTCALLVILAVLVAIVLRAVYRTIRQMMNSK